MVNALLDTSVLVDVLRDYAPAQNWFTQQTDLGVSTVVILELLQGASNKIAQNKALDLLQGLEQVEVLPQDFEWGIQALTRYNLSHGVMGLDALIAAVSYRLEVPLYTLNIKHFQPMLADWVRRPY